MEEVCTLGHVGQDRPPVPMRTLSTHTKRIFFDVPMAQKSACAVGAYCTAPPRQQSHSDSSSRCTLSVVLHNQQSIWLLEEDCCQWSTDGSAVHDAIPSVIFHSSKIRIQNIWRVLNLESNLHFRDGQKMMMLCRPSRALIGFNVSTEPLIGRYHAHSSQ
jgi:hypothetical protein